MSEIKILNVALVEQATIANVVAAQKVEEINGNNTLSFTLALTSEISALINDTAVIGLGTDYYDIATYEKSQNGGSFPFVKVECEHISYRLNDSAYDEEYFTSTGTPTAVLTALLAGTGFTVGTVDFVDAVTYSAQEKKSRRALLMEFVAYLGGELSCNGFEISILTARGSAVAKDLTVGGNVTVIGMRTDKRTTPPTKYYNCALINPMALNLGDVVTLHYDLLDIDISMRIVSITTNPYNSCEVSFEISNITPSLEDDIYRIETSTVAKDKLYYGARIGPEYGFESVRSDKKARSYFNADNIAFQTGDGSGSNWVNKLYYELDELGHAKLIFDGELTANVINAIKANIDIVISNTIITQNLYAARGTIADLTVDRLDTSDKVANFLASSKADVNYQKIYDQHFQWITATYAGDVDGQDNKVQLTDRNGSAVYWIDDTHTGTTMDVTDYPVYVYVYDELVKMDISFEEIDGEKTPIITWGAGVGNSEHPEWGKGYAYKGPDGLHSKYITATGTVQDVVNGEEGIYQIGNTGAAGLRNIAVGTVAPNDPQTNDLWIDTDA